MPCCRITVRKSATWILDTETIFDFKCNHLIEGNHQTRSISCRLCSLANLVNLGNFIAFFFVQKELYLWKSFVQEVQVSQKSVVSEHFVILTNNELVNFYLIF